MATHHINKVILDFSFLNGESDVALQKTKDLFYGIAVRQIDELFDKTTERISIDKLEIDIGRTTEANFAEKFSSAFLAAMEKSAPRFSPGTTVGAKTDGAMVETSAGVGVQDIVAFLKSGYWPWNIQQKSSAEILAALQAFFGRKERVVLLFAEIRKSGTVSANRLVQLMWHTAALRKLLVESIVAVHPYLMETETLLTKIFAKVVSAEPGFHSVFIDRLMHHEPLQTFAGFRQFVVSFFDGPFLIDETPTMPQEAVVAKIKKLLFRTNGQPSIKEWLPLLETLVLKTDNLPGIYNGTTTISGEGFFMPSDEAEKIGITNSGLLLLHPYLPLVFREFGWIDGGKKFINERFQQKAVLFLQFIINGKSRQQEHLLVLNKLLCGWPVSRPLRTGCRFSLAEKKAAEELLDSLIEHWSVLRNTSRGGLVKSFIERKGLVQQKEKSFLVQVEKNTIDILLESLPFGIQTIKLPWNGYIIYTEWAY